MTYPMMSIISLMDMFGKTIDFFLFDFWSAFFNLIDRA